MCVLDLTCRLLFFTFCPIDVELFGCGFLRYVYVLYLLCVYFVVLALILLYKEGVKAQVMAHLPLPLAMVL